MVEACINSSDDLRDGVGVASALDVARRQSTPRRAGDCDSREDGGHNERTSCEHLLRVGLDEEVRSSYRFMYFPSSAILSR